MLRRDDSALLAIVALSLGKDALDKTRRAPQDCADALNLNDVYADGNYHK